MYVCMYNYIRSEVAPDGSNCADLVCGACDLHGLAPPAPAPAPAGKRGPGA